LTVKTQLVYVVFYLFVRVTLTNK